MEAILKVTPTLNNFNGDIFLLLRTQNILVTFSSRFKVSSFKCDFSNLYNWPVPSISAAQNCVLSQKKKDYLRENYFLTLFFCDLKKLREIGLVSEVLFWAALFLYEAYFNTWIDIRFVLSRKILPNEKRSLKKNA